MANNYYFYFYKYYKINNKNNMSTSTRTSSNININKMMIKKTKIKLQYLKDILNTKSMIEQKFYNISNLKVLEIIPEHQYFLNELKLSNDFYSCITETLRNSSIDEFSI